MAYDTELAERVRKYLANSPGLTIEEKKMFGGLAFMVNGKMCINVSGENLMCRFDPARQEIQVRPCIRTQRKTKGFISKKES